MGLRCSEEGPSHISRPMIDWVRSGLLHIMAFDASSADVWPFHCLEVCTLHSYCIPRRS